MRPADYHFDINANIQQPNAFGRCHLLSATNEARPRRIGYISHNSKAISNRDVGVESHFPVLSSGVSKGVLSPACSIAPTGGFRQCNLDCG